MRSGTYFAHMDVEFILYVEDQGLSRDFYRTLLGRTPTLDVPGMTEFDLGSCKLGLMPSAGIARIISPTMPHPSTGNGVPRCELYLVVEDLDASVDRAQQAGAKIVDAAKDRDWGHRVAYFADPDAHIIAIAQVIH